MWHTPDGERHLVGQEGALVRESLGVMVDNLSELADGRSEDTLGHWNYGVAVFDSLTWSQQLALLHQVARHLLTETAEPLPLNAVTESAVGAIFAHVRQQVEIEIDIQRFDDEALDDDFADLPSWRERVLAAYQETLSADEGLEWDEEGSLPAADETDIDAWHDLIEILADRVLWDRDYEMGELVLDAEPAKAAALKQLLGIDDDYYTGLAPDARDRHIQPLLSEIRAITHAKPR